MKMRGEKSRVESLSNSPRNARKINFRNETRGCPNKAIAITKLCVKKIAKNEHKLSEMIGISSKLQRILRAHPRG